MKARVAIDLKFQPFHLFFLQEKTAFSPVGPFDSTFRQRRRRRGKEKGRKTKKAPFRLPPPFSGTASTQGKEKKKKKAQVFPFFPLLPSSEYSSGGQNPRGEEERADREKEEGRRGTLILFLFLLFFLPSRCQGGFVSRRQEIGTEGGKRKERRKEGISVSPPSPI